MRALLVVGLLGLLGLLPACAIPARTPPALETPVGETPAATPRPSTPPPAASASDQLPLGALLPGELDGVELHTFATNQDLLARMAPLVGLPLEELEVAYASEHGARFIQAMAVRGRGVPADTLLEAFAASAYDPSEASAVEVGADTLAGQDVVVVHDAQLAPRLGTFYGFVRGGALIVVQSFDRDAAAALIGALPAAE